MKTWQTVTVMFRAYDTFWDVSGKREKQLFLKKFYCLRQGTSKRGEGFPFLSCRGWKTA